MIYPKSSSGHYDWILQVDQRESVRILLNIIADLTTEDLPDEIQLPAKISVLVIRNPGQDLWIWNPVLWIVILHLVFQGEVEFHELLEILLSRDVVCFLQQLLELTFNVLRIGFELHVHECLGIRENPGHLDHVKHRLRPIVAKKVWPGIRDGENCGENMKPKKKSLFVFLYTRI